MTRKHLLLAFTIILLISLTSAIETCGNEIINYPEQCDNFNLNGATCQSLGFDSGILSCYPDGRDYASCTFDITGCLDTCGNEVIDINEGEQCDDGNNQSNDGCSETCQIEYPIIIPDIDPDEPFCYESLEICAEVTSTTPLNYIKISCNSGSTQINKTMIPHSGNTYCAGLSNTTLGTINGTTVQCTITAENQAGQATETISTTYNCPDCGNNITERTETCDNGNLNGILCNAGYESFCEYCTDECIFEQIEGPSCGDEICQTEYEEDWQNCNQDCEKPAICGDTILDTNEQCDLGTPFNTDTCNPLYDQSCSYCSLTCQNETEQGPFCGDTICNSEFENWTTCNQDCEKPQICGDGFVDLNEQCDGGTNCQSDCTLKEEEKRTYKTSSSITKYYDDCQPIWECSSWGECDTDVKHRNCIDTNHCLYPYNQPLETTGCEIIKESKIEKQNNPWLFMLLAILAFILVVLIIFYKK